MLQGSNLSSHDAGPIRTITVGTGGGEDEEPSLCFGRMFNL